MSPPTSACRICTTSTEATVGKRLDEYAEQHDDDLEVERLHERIAQRDRKISGLERTVRKLTVERDDLAREREAFFDDLTKGQRQPPKWTQAKRSKNRKHATPVLMLSDLHFDEVVDPEAMHFLNAYDRRIAEIRFAHTVEMACELPTEYFTGLNYDGIVVLCGGDWWAGWIQPWPAAATWCWMARWIGKCVRSTSPPPPARPWPWPSAMPWQRYGWSAPEFRPKISPSTTQPARSGASSPSRWPT